MSVIGKRRASLIKNKTQKLHGFYRWKEMIFEEEGRWYRSGVNMEAALDWIEVSLHSGWVSSELSSC